MGLEANDVSQVKQALNIISRHFYFVSMLVCPHKLLTTHTRSLLHLILVLPLSLKLSLRLSNIHITCRQVTKLRKKNLPVRARLICQWVILNYFCPNFAASVEHFYIWRRLVCTIAMNDFCSNSAFEHSKKTDHKQHTA